MLIIIIFMPVMFYRLCITLLLRDSLSGYQIWSNWKALPCSFLLLFMILNILALIMSFRLTLAVLLHFPLMIRVFWRCIMSVLHLLLWKRVRILIFFLISLSRSSKRLIIFIILIIYLFIIIIIFIIIIVILFYNFLYDF
jgi:hypothetical protein